jgi:hypothetical protein
MKDGSVNGCLINPFTGSDVDTVSLVAKYTDDIMGNPNYWSELAKRLLEVDGLILEEE